MAELRVIDYQPTWPAQYAQVEAELRAALSPLDAALEHIGSTAVPGLCAKPVIDVALGVDALDGVAMRIAALAAIGFVYRPEYESVIPERRYFVRAAGGTPRVHLHALVRAGALWRQHLLFRDALRRDPALMQSYASLKQHLAVRYASEKAAYTEAKGPFIEKVLAAAGTGIDPLRELHGGNRP
ncbi:GrpB family protein [Cognatilysobacter tabacisoli]|uniref:GrpB family protein n=1 Tax=Cognatilysobacter tabacisoli TaxID=2315424 RepID=UPI000E6B48B1|nr:GrpB family protein [Lysobacter tabacisoli]